MHVVSEGIYRFIHFAKVFSKVYKSWTYSYPVCLKSKKNCTYSHQNTFTRKFLAVLFITNLFQPTLCCSSGASKTWVMCTEKSSIWLLILAAGKFKQNGATAGLEAPSCISTWQNSELKMHQRGQACGGNQHNLTRTTYGHEVDISPFHGGAMAQITLWCPITWQQCYTGNHISTSVWVGTDHIHTIVKLWRHHKQLKCPSTVLPSQYLQMHPINWRSRTI